MQTRIGSSRIPSRLANLLLVIALLFSTAIGFLAPAKAAPAQDHTDPPTSVAIAGDFQEANRHQY